MTMRLSSPTIALQDLKARLAQGGFVLPSGALPFMFGNTPELASHLASLVATGQKTATAGLLWAW